MSCIFCCTFQWPFFAYLSFNGTLMIAQCCLAHFRHEIRLLFYSVIFGFTKHFPSALNWLWQRGRIRNLHFEWNSNAFHSVLMTRFFLVWMLRMKIYIRHDTTALTIFWSIKIIVELSCRVVGRMLWVIFVINSVISL